MKPSAAVRSLDGNLEQAVQRRPGRIALEEAQGGGDRLDRRHLARPRRAAQPLRGHRQPLGEPQHRQAADDRQLLVHLPRLGPRPIEDDELLG